MATTRNWLGGEHEFFDPNAWTPAGTPATGDTLIIGPGTPSSANIADVHGRPLNDVTVLLDDGPGPVGSPDIPILSLENTAIGSGTLIENPIETSTAFGALDTEEIRVSGTALNNGTIVENPRALVGNTLNIALADGSTLINGHSGTISGTTLSQLNIEGGSGASLTNNGKISGQGTTLDVGVPVTGNGEFAISRGPNPGSHTSISRTLEFHDSVGAQQTVALNDSTLVLDQPLSFLGTIDDTSVSPPGPSAANSSILLNGEHATDLSFQDNTLTVTNGQQTLAQLNFTPGLTAADFSLTDTTEGSRIAIAAPSAAAGSAQASSDTQLVVPTVLPANA